MSTIDELLSFNDRNALEQRKLAQEILTLEAQLEKHRNESDKIRQEAATVARNNRALDSYGENVGVYHFYDDVNHRSVAKTILEFGNIARRNVGARLKLVLNSPGGSVLDGLALYDFVRLLREEGHDVEVVALGMAASMGGVILQAGSTRTLGSNSWLLIHEVSAGALGNISELEDRMEFLKRLQQNILGILTERSTMSKEEIEEKWKKKDWWLSAEEALALGFIDRIL